MLDELLAPIALYPDQLLVQILTAAANPQEVLDGGNWLYANPNIKGDALDKAAKAAGFSPSMQVLLHFPDVVDMMCRKMDWTKQLGEAFQSNQTDVLASIQRLRTAALNAGTLRSTPQQKVEKKSDNGTEFVEIQPANSKTVYVPQYNPDTVYTPPPAEAAAPQTTVAPQPEQQSGVSTSTAVLTSLITFGAGIALGAAINDHNYYPYPAWGRGGVYYGGRPWYGGAYPPYRPAYGGGWGYASTYRRPPYNNALAVNNNYYNRFQNNTNLRTGYHPTNPVTLPANRARYANSQYKPAVSNQPAGVRGQSTYAGANRPPPNGNNGPGGNANVAANRAEMRPNAAASRSEARPSVAENRSAIPAVPAKATAARAGNVSGDRGYSAPAKMTKNATQPARTAPQSRPAATEASNRGDAFGSGSSSGASERSASARGRSSMNAPSKPASAPSKPAGGRRH